MKHIVNILAIALAVVLVVGALRFGSPSEALVWHILGGFLTMVTVVSIDDDILDLWEEGCHDRPIPSSILDIPDSAIGLLTTLWPLVAVTYLPVRYATLVKRHLEARRKRSNPEGVSPTHTTPGSVPGASTPPICASKKGDH